MPERTGFWRRAVAFVIDGLIVCLALQCVAIIAFPLSNARVQASSGIERVFCRKLTAPPPGIAMPIDFEANFATDCRWSILGFDTAHTITVGRFTRDGNTTKTVSITVLANDQGVPIRGLSLNLLLGPLFVLFRCWSDGQRGSPGRRLCGMRLLVAVDGEDISPPRAVLSLRYLVFVLPGIPIWLLDFYAGLYPSFALFGGPFIPIMIGSITFAWMAAIWASLAIIRRRDAFYDIAAGTVVRRAAQQRPIRSDTR
ncbi:RDD family protein [Methylobacterium platani]|uniref:RDD family protein n=1 Tax=Methylobacterium platani TaxID=427683 RepID=UPI0009E3241D|nr:RDD family protein [Methylobacterium platani]